LSCPQGYDHYIIGDLNVNLVGDENKQWVKTANDLGFKQLINRSTRVTLNLESLIDHIYVNNKNNVSNSGVLELSFSDHYSVFMRRKNHFKTIEQNKRNNKNIHCRIS
jgi:endonuclease/exonuclease/phosphatase family metal-dependent hydrolase